VEASAVRIHHPNREKPQSKATKAAVTLLLVASAALIALVTIGGYAQLAGATMIAVAYVLIYLLMAYFVMRWNRGVLPLASGMAIIFTCFAAVAAPAWFARDEDGFTDPLLPAGLLGLLILVIIAVQLVLVIFAMRGFQQEWSTEVEVREGDEHDDDYEYEDAEEQDAGEYETYEGSAEDRSDDSPRQG
jgi:amino acid transporter